MPVQASDLTAFGFGADDSTLQRNINQVLDDLRLDGNIPEADIDGLAMRLSGQPKPFDIFIHVLPENRLDRATISQRIHGLTGRYPVQIHGWQP